MYHPTVPPVAKASECSRFDTRPPSEPLAVKISNLREPLCLFFIFLPLYGSQHRQLVQQDVVEVLPNPKNVVLSQGVEVVPLPALLLTHEVVHGKPHLVGWGAEIGIKLRGGGYAVLRRGVGD